jgi:hypothetical protein
MLTYSYVLALLMQLTSGQHIGQSRLVVSAVVDAVNHTADTTFTKDLLAAILLVTAYGESRFNPQASGDNGLACGIYQTHAVDKATCLAYKANVYLATTAAIVWITKSAAICPDAPLSPYCGGCNNRTARAIAKARLDKAYELVWGF